MDTARTKKEMAEAAYIQGERAFMNGRYQDTIKELTRCLAIEKDEQYEQLEIDAYNMLGMLFSFVGYESNALDNYLSAFEAAEQHDNIQGQVATLLNIGLLYQGIGQFSKAMKYYSQAKETAEKNMRNPEIMLKLCAEIQIAQLLCKRGKYSEAISMRRDIEGYHVVAMESEFLLPLCILDIYIEEYQNNETAVNDNLMAAVSYLNRDNQFMEQIDFYVDLCNFLLEKDKKDQLYHLLYILKEKLQMTEFFRLKICIEELEVEYQKKYGNTETEDKATMEFMILYREYDSFLRQFRKMNVENIESLQKIEQKKIEFENRSKHDLATGLLNKKAFRQEVEQYLKERSETITDAMMFVDIDNFKLINDSFGHLLGDEVIRVLSEIMQKKFDTDCVKGRFGGDEFTVFMKNISDMSKTEEIIESLRQEFADHGFGKNRDIYVTVSIGVSYNYEMKASYESLLSCADEALEKAKEYGKNRVAFYEIKRGILKYV